MKWQINAAMGLAFLALFSVPDTALAGGITEFAGPVQQVVDTLRGPVGRIICIFMIIMCGVGYWFSRGEEVAGFWKALVGVVFIMTLIAGAMPVVDKLFSFSGAVL